jgi:hypothetical protein
MHRRAWFCYEETSRGFSPVIHYDSLPNGKNILNPKVVQSWELGESWFTTQDEHSNISKEVQASFNELAVVFPMPEQVVEYE